ncbi:MAG TPA: hypothetical protein VJ761_07105 [Ktedonobacteraceae bacterium]|nr:hypothetical protein [Ktedonobacteraceae bacterium]
MNCERCKTLLPPDARFCRVCGFPVPTSTPADNLISPSPFNAPTIISSPTSPPPSPTPWIQPPTQPTPPPVIPQQQWGSSTEVAPSSGPQWVQPTQAALPSGPQWVQPTQAVPESYPSPMVIPAPVGTMQSTGGQPAPAPSKPRRRRGCLPKILITLVILLAVVVGGWIIGLRPYLHSLAQSQIDQELASSVDQIIPLPPPVNTLTVTDTMINNLIGSDHSSDPVQNTHVTITSSGLKLDFQVYGFPCSVTGNLIASNGKPVITNVGIQGIVGLIMSPDELTPILNNHLSDAQSRLHRLINTITLKDHEIDLSLGDVTI